ncbi:MAG: CBS domain-containing protein [Thermoproteota archaeon]|nr:CBS domain-containing protein [Thermoproteota archaeon]
MTRQTISSALGKRVGDVADRDFAALPEDMLVGVAVKIMRDRDVSSILVSKSKKNMGNNYSNSYSSTTSELSPQLWHHPVLSKETAIGILTERDILYRVMAENRGPYKVALGHIMSSPLITINENASVRDAIGLMQSKQIRRLPVIRDNGTLKGLITLKTVIGNMPSHNIDLAELESSRSIAEIESVCPYCRSVIREGNTIADHMEGSHMHTNQISGCNIE